MRHFVVLIKFREKKSFFFKKLPQPTKGDNRVKTKKSCCKIIIGGVIKDYSYCSMSFILLFLASDTIIRGDFSTVQKRCCASAKFIHLEINRRRLEKIATSLVCFF